MEISNGRSVKYESKVWWPTPQRFVFHFDPRPFADLDQDIPITSSDSGRQRRVGPSRRTLPSDQLCS